MQATGMMPNGEEKKETSANTVSTKKDPRGEWTPNLLCPKCYAKGVFVKEGMPPLCADCLKIELGLTKRLYDKAMKVKAQKKRTTKVQTPSSQQSQEPPQIGSSK